MSTSNSISLTAANIDFLRIDPQHRPVVAVPSPSKEAADEVAKRLAENHYGFHIFFNLEIGMHNHLAHHLPTLWALGASPAQITHHFLDNASYQLPAPAPALPSPTTDLTDPAKFTAMLSQSRSYTDYLRFFDHDIQTRGWRATLQTYLFDQTPLAARLLRQLYAGVVHPFIHFGFGIEFGIKGVIAEGLAETSVHRDELERYFLAVEEVAGRRKKEGKEETVQLMQLYRELRANQKIMGTKGLGAEEGGTFGTPVINRALPEIAAIAGRYVVKEEDLEDRIGEMVNVNAYLVAAIQHPPHVPRFDFFLIHSHNAAIFQTAFLRQLTRAQAARLLTMQVWYDIIAYATQGISRTPEAHLNYLLSFAPHCYPGTSWEELYAIANRNPDNGHTIKMLRACRHAEDLAGRQRRFEEPLAKEKIIDIARIMMKTTDGRKIMEHGEPLKVDARVQWVFGAGHEQPWNRFEVVKTNDRVMAQL